MTGTIVHEGLALAVMSLLRVVPGKANYNSLASPFEIEFGCYMQGIHIRTGTIVAQVLADTVGAPGRPTLEFLRDDALPKILEALSGRSGLGCARDRVCENLARVYTVASATTNLESDPPK
ncbi:hypothetical protein HDU88_008490 [Geranomyces variabilis]|nr:hypothetical protein HDU88_008490 [Geranomyces variabilis]